MKKLIIIILTLLFVSISGVQAQGYRTQTNSEIIKTLLVRVTDNWEAAPVIRMNSDETIDISFDLLSPSPEYYTYKITHCNADWKPSQLIESEYMTGLQFNPLNDYANSFNTQPEYINYKLTLPNENNDFKVSGNYAVEVYNETDDYPIVRACFSVIESRVDIDMEVSPITDKGVHTKYQAVSFGIKYGNEVRSPSQDLKVYVYQNNRLDNQAALVKPMGIQGGRAVYNHNPALIFDGGNEYRTFEMTTTQFNGLNIETYEFHSPFYHAILKPDIIRVGRAYSFVNDIDGRIYINNIRYEDADLESDYRIVHFYIPCERALSEKVYILSEAFNNIFNTSSEMEYNAQEGGYIKTALLKEGYYNYLYVTKPINATTANTELIEGNHYETENEYRVMVYFRPFGQRYDQLIGMQTLQFNK